MQIYYSIKPQTWLVVSGAFQGGRSWSYGVIMSGGQSGYYSGLAEIVTFGSFNAGNSSKMMVPIYLANKCIKLLYFFCSLSLDVQILCGFVNCFFVNTTTDNRLRLLITRTRCPTGASWGEQQSKFAHRCSAQFPFSIHFLLGGTGIHHITRFVTTTSSQTFDSCFLTVRPSGWSCYLIVLHARWSLCTIRTERSWWMHQRRLDQSHTETDGGTNSWSADEAKSIRGIG